MTESPARTDRPAAGHGRRTIFLIAAVVLAPVVASYIVYYLFPQEAQVNYGTLLATVPAPAVVGTRADGTAFRLDELHGRWVLLSGGRGCDAACERKLYATRQARTMQGKDQDRIVRVWLASGDNPPTPDLVAEHPGLLVIRVGATGLERFPGGAGPIYLIDPLGNLVLRYPDNPDIRGIANDLARVLKASRIG
ncbi:MAG: hypothetical protein ABI724_07020 [Betaproteobacteria bacterium]